MRQLQFGGKIKTLPIHQLSNFQYRNLFALTGGVRLYQTGLEGFLSNEFSLMIKTLDMILRLDPLFQTHDGRHDWKDYKIISERGCSIPWSKVSDIGTFLGGFTWHSLRASLWPHSPCSGTMHDI